MSANVRQTNGECAGRTVESATLTGTQESSEDSTFTHRKGGKPIKIDGRQSIYSVAFLGDGKHVVSGGWERKIRRWRVEDGQEVGLPMDAGSPIRAIATSQDGKWVVSGTDGGFVTVWSAGGHSKLTKLTVHKYQVWAVDVSQDGAGIATGSGDTTVCVWSASTGERLLGPLGHDEELAMVKFSPDERLIATASWRRDIRVYDSQTGGLVAQVLRDYITKVNLIVNDSLVWASDSKQLFDLSQDANVNCLDVSTGTALSKWAIHSSKDPRCIALARNGTFIAASANLSVSFWDTTTHEQIGSVITHIHAVRCLAISTNYDLVIGGDNTITIWGLCDILPYRYLHYVCEQAHTRSLSNHNPLRYHDSLANGKFSTQKLKKLI